MRAGLNTIQQTLTPEAATVLNHSIAEAGRRNHGQTTPLHVAATLLSAPSGFLRQACIKSHPNSSHPLQCRALELCFSVALERLPTVAHTITTTPALEPPISNALMAALKRAQAHQRRGCPEQQQQPLLAVKVELEQLIISILDDPSVSRVMREASFSSLAVKATIEQSMNSSNSNVNSSPIGLGFRPAPTGIIAGPPNRNSYLNPRLQQGTGQRSEEVKKVVDILMRTKKMNPVLVGDSEPEAVIKELFRRIESKELNQGLLKNVEVIHLEKELVSDKAQIPGKIKELGNLVESRIANSNGGGVILDLGDVKWLVEHSGSFGVPGAVQVVSEAGRAAVAEMVKILARFREGSGTRLWLIGIATCETYMRCQIYHPTMESDWDLQALPIATRSPLPGMFPRLGTNIILNSVEFLPALKGFPPTTAPPSLVSENLDPAQRAASCCPLCTQNYEQELAKLVAKEFEKSSSEVKSEAARPPLPQWLQNAKAEDAEVKTTGLPQAKDQESTLKQKTQELQKKWNNTCLHLHPNFHQHNCSRRIVPTPIPMTDLYSPNLLGCQPFQQKLSPSKNLGATLHLNSNPVASQSPERTCSPSVYPVRTELVLGRTKLTETTTPQIIHKDRVQDFSGCISSESQSRFHELQSDKLTASTLDADSFKRLLRGLMEKVWWQRDAASAVAATVTQCKLGNGNQRGAGSRGDVWLLFTGPEKVGKKKMASALSELVSGANPIVISLGCRRDGRESELNFRGKTVIDRISEAVRRNPFSVIMLEDIDEADMILCGNIKRAMERGRLVDSYGREISLGNVIFILTANWLPENLKFVSYRDEEKLANLAKGDWQLKLSLCEKSSKRRPNWLHHDQDRATKPRKETASTLSFDLNEAADDAEDDGQDGVNNSSDLTIDHEEDNRRLLTASSVFRELLNSVDDTIVFKPVDFGAIRRDITNSIAKKFSTIVKYGISMEVQDDALEKILGGVWLGRTGLDEWTEKVLVPSLHQLKSRMPSTISGTPNESLVVRLELDGDSNSRSHGNWLPSSIKVVVDGL